MTISKHYKYSYILLGLYVTFLLLTVALANRLTEVGVLLEPGGIYVFPLTFPICDIMSEVYGYSYPRLFIWVGASCEFVFAIIATMISHFPYPAYFHHVKSYQAVFDPTIRFVLSSLVGTIIGEFLNVYLLSKWKIKFKGKYFMFRSFGSTGIGQAALSVIVDLLAFAGTMKFSSLIWMMACGYFWKMLYSFILVFPSWLVVRYLKKVENADHYDINTDFNPFRMRLES